MQSGNQEPFLNFFQKSLLIFFFVLIIFSLILFKNLFFKPTILLKSFGEVSLDPEIAFKNNKPTFIEFYAEWCEICKEMAPEISDIKNEYESDINFVFLNVDNPKWQTYIRKYNVNGIPQVNLFDNQGNLQDTFIGRQDEKIIKGSLENLNDNFQSKKEITNSDFSLIKKNRNYQFFPRSHG